ncbi:MAG: septum formation initiator family protein [Lachnospiraceae bacterium]|jgi:cell division protein FtsB|nr:septum formation initiator family protein [Lachnospiraceae bacterium]
MMKKRKLKRYRRKGPNNRVGMILVTAVLLMVFAASMVKIISLKQTQKVYDEKKEYYSTLVEDEVKRSEELVEFEKYTQTDAYIEEVAKQRFGLVKDGEIIFVAEEK